MKKFINISIFTLFSICLTSILTACQEEEFGFTQQEISYESAFVKEYGRPVEGSTFGFVDQPIVDATALTRTASTNANEWGGYANVPAPLTQAQIDFVTNWFATTKSPAGIAVSWTDYFAQQVSSTSYGPYMNFVLDAGHDGTDHINNFNSGDCSVNSNVWDGTLTNPNDPNSKVYHSDKIQYMLGQSTESFAYHETMSSKTWYDHYVVIPGETIDPTNQHGLAGMYFLGFDYEAAGQSDNQKVPRDYYFNDWIIKITPGLRKGYTNVVRIMCEDLGNSHDWDWNDVVFDVSFESSWSQEQSKNITEAIITVQCAGGTLPIYIGQTTKEVHSLWKKPSSEVIIHPSAPVIYRVDVTNMPGVVSNGTANARNIPVYVYSESATNTIQANKIPQKFACPNTVAWSEELVNICETYPEFPTWITDDQSVKDAWEKVWGLDPKNDISNGINTGETNHEQVLIPVPEPEPAPEPEITPEPTPEPTPSPEPEPEPTPAPEPEPTPAPEPEVPEGITLISLDNLSSCGALAGTNVTTSSTVALPDGASTDGILTITLVLERIYDWMAEGSGIDITIHSGWNEQVKVEFNCLTSSAIQFNIAYKDAYKNGLNFNFSNYNIKQMYIK